MLVFTLVVKLFILSLFWFIVVSKLFNLVVLAFVLSFKLLMFVLFSVITFQFPLILLSCCSKIVLLASVLVSIYVLLAAVLVSTYALFTISSLTVGFLLYFAW